MKPTKETIQDGSYTPLSRPLFMYPSKKAMARPEVKAFMDFTVENQETIAEAAQIVPLTEEQASEAKTVLGGGLATWPSRASRHQRALRGSGSI